jgi:hypothetical protein
MDDIQDNTLVEVLSRIPDPRKARGQRHSWLMQLTLVASAISSGMRNGRAIAQWVQEHTQELLHSLRPPRGTLPSESTLRRTIRQVDIAALETQLGQWGQDVRDTTPEDGCIITKQGVTLHGQAIDGKAVRGAGTHGEPVHLVSRVQHGCGTTLGQMQVANKRNEITAVPPCWPGAT